MGQLEVQSWRCSPAGAARSNACRHPPHTHAHSPRRPGLTRLGGRLERDGQLLGARHAPPLRVHAAAAHRLHLQQARQAGRSGGSAPAAPTAPAQQQQPSTAAQACLPPRPRALKVAALAASTPQNWEASPLGMVEAPSRSTLPAARGQQATAGVAVQAGTRAGGAAGRLPHSSSRQPSLAAHHPAGRQARAHWCSTALRRRRCCPAPPRTPTPCGCWAGSASCKRGQSGPTLAPPPLEAPPAAAAAAAVAGQPRGAPPAPAAAAPGTACWCVTCQSVRPAGAAGTSKPPAVSQLGEAGGERLQRRAAGAGRQGAVHPALSRICAPASPRSPGRPLGTRAAHRWCWRCRRGKPSPATCAPGWACCRPVFWGRSPTLRVGGQGGGASVAWTPTRAHLSTRTAGRRCSAARSMPQRDSHRSEGAGHALLTVAVGGALQVQQPGHDFTLGLPDQDDLRGRARGAGGSGSGGQAAGLRAARSRQAAAALHCESDAAEGHLQLARGAQR